MLLLIIFSFIAGVITILSPCILPILPVVLASSSQTGKKRPIGIVIGFILSFTFFTLFLTQIVKYLGVSADILRNISIIVIALFGFSLIIPKIQKYLEQLFANFSKFTPKATGSEGFLGGVILGLSIGLLWTPCVGPILATVITLAATSTVSLGSVFITLAYSLGTAIPMFFVLLTGRALLSKIPWLFNNLQKVQRFFGILMILVAIAMFFNVDRQFQTYILEKFPSYGTGLTSIENNDSVKKTLDELKSNESKSDTSTELLNVKSPFKAPDFIAGGSWINSEPLTLSSLRGKVVLVDFWTYTCINCIRTLPYLKDWYQKYEKDGFVIVGVHTPEFAFEHLLSNVKKATLDFGLKYPIVQDNDYATWEAYNNRFWPAEYLIDKDGMVRRTHFGEGEYDQTEKAIQALLKEMGADITEPISDIKEQTPKVQISPETYVGASRMRYFYPSGNTGNGTNTFSKQTSIPKNSFTFGGTWTISDEDAKAGDNASLIYRFTADKVYLVMRPGSGENKVRVLLDGKPINADSAGADVLDGYVTIDSDRLYNLVDLKGKTETHLLELEFSNGVSAFAFTFG